MEGVSWRCCTPVGDGTSWVNGGRDYCETVRAAGPRVAAPPGLVGYLAGRYRHSSEEQWAEHVRAGRVSLDGRRSTADDAAQPVRPGLRLCYHRPPWQEPLPHAPEELAALYEDEDVLAVLKPSGLAVMPSELYWNHTVMAVLRRTYAGADSLPSPAHRLGVATSGVLLCAKSARAKRSLPAQFQAGTVGKEYRALASGVDMPDEFSCTQPIGLVEVTETLPLANDSPWWLGCSHVTLRLQYPGIPEGLFAAADGGKPATSHCRVLERRPEQGATLMAVRIETGRPHQIRIHLAAAGHPLVGDPLYGSGGVPLPSAVAAAAEGAAPLPRDTGYLLHSAVIAFDHPQDAARRVTVRAETAPQCPAILCEGG